LDQIALYIIDQTGLSAKEMGYAVCSVTGKYTRANSF